MKRSLLCSLSLWLLLTIPAKAQMDPSRWMIGVTAGPAFPTGTFAGYHSYLPSSGGVSTGENAELSAEYRLYRSFSVAIVISGQLNHGAGEPYYLTQEQAQSNSNTGLRSDWQMTRVLAGGVYTIPLSGRRGPDPFIRLLAGIQQTRTPDYSFISGNPGIPSVREPGTTLPWAFAYETGAGIKWPVSGRCTLLTFAGYTRSHPVKEAPNVFESCPLGGCSGPPLPDGTFVTQTLFLRAGIAFLL